jgi:hypothetical protein
LTILPRAATRLLAIFVAAAPALQAADDDTNAAPKAQPVPVALPAAPTMPAIASSPTSPDLLASINATAKGLAGLKGSGSWEATPEWQDYARQLDGEWRGLEQVRLNAMKTWGATELADLRERSSTVFYPFSGPDVLYADTFFPTSKVLIMAGLEPVGTVPDLAKLQADGKLGPYLATIKTSLFTILAASFFKTKDMKVDFNNQLVDGLMPAIIVFLAHAGYEITDLQPVVVDHEGDVAPRGSRPGSPGVQITYADGRQLYYFQADLGNDGLKKSPGFVKMMQRLAPGVTYLKAASYLLYEDYFSTMREAILQDSLGVVEDDSGIPFKDFPSRDWDVIPYGDYTGPITLFKEHLQPDLAAYYKKTPHQQLPFGSGYKFAASVSSLLVVKKKMPASGEVAPVAAPAQ